MVCSNEQVAKYNWYGGIWRYVRLSTQCLSLSAYYHPLESLQMLSEYCRLCFSWNLTIQLMSWLHDGSEFLIHAADVEGLCQGIDEELVRSKFEIITKASRSLYRIELGQWVRIPTTYAGGAKGTLENWKTWIPCTILRHRSWGPRLGGTGVRRACRSYIWKVCLLIIKRMP